ncbi:MAG TPA: hydroxymethylglutaryl-CoA lyase [Bacteroidia bacterium]|nr:hydroxymethylglutaryl-CoA lyase [Bacteroidia bacterium]HRH09394.1 hydroxymethylglutaryl-CoA lyase [Bacteroidia bacterium]
MKIIECPRDAMQGIEEFIPTQKKIDYINSLLRVGFDTIDFGSFVSPKAIPQLRDTSEVLAGLDLSNTSSKLLAIVANTRGAEAAVEFEEINYLGYPFSISETFQMRNTNATIQESLIRVEEIQNLCERNNKKLVIYISMAFGNPYGDEWSSDVAIYWTGMLHRMGIKIIALSDTVGVSTPESIEYLFSNLIPRFNAIEFGAHLHSTPETRMEKIGAAYTSGCRRFDVAIHGFGGCPMANDNLVGNLSTESLIHYLETNKLDPKLNKALLLESYSLANSVFPLHA